MGEIFKPYTGAAAPPRPKRKQHKVKRADSSDELASVFAHYQQPVSPSQANSASTSSMDTSDELHHHFGAHIRNQEPAPSSGPRVSKPLSVRSSSSGLDEIFQRFQVHSSTSGVSRAVSEDVGPTASAPSDHTSSKSSTSSTATNESEYQPLSPERHDIELEMDLPELGPDGGRASESPSPDRTEKKARYLSCPELWQTAWEHRDSIHGAEWLHLSVINFHLLSVWYDMCRQPQTQPRALYLDCRVANAWRTEDTTRLALIEPLMAPQLRQNCFLPPAQPCPHQPVVLVVQEPLGMRVQRHRRRRRNQQRLWDGPAHVFVVVIEHERQQVHVLGRAGSVEAVAKDEDWEAWDGPQYYEHVCNLFGWEAGDLDDVLIRSAWWEQNGFDCGPQAVEVATFALKHGVPRSSRGETAPPPIPCGHRLRYQIYSRLIDETREALETYEALRTYRVLPQEWFATDLVRGLPGGIDATDVVMQQSIIDANHGRSDRTLAEFQAQMRACLLCAGLLEAGDAGASSAQGNTDHRHFLGDEAGAESGDDEPQGELRDEPGQPEPESEGRSELGNSPEPQPTYRPGHLYARPQHAGPRRFPRPTAPPPAPPAIQPLWPAFSSVYDDYRGGPTAEENRERGEQWAFDGPGRVYGEGQADPQRRGPWTRFRDYGYRVLHRLHPARGCARGLEPQEGPP
ncbi:hypothetical protein BOTBODRAFT_182395 [Botryobasidium botryosum FD-172 SS1]|uniref:Uncharacterized protein n=1 Tax=Botryobasidium botryosum (strain FD-172 SS1) TaxID=930990 RepID=A0A067LTP1_BOTB1|nr:hypothetical protein BOTBODRAFT_182395 [Botryobasidium botryosum FD-172 SS1]